VEAGRQRHQPFPPAANPSPDRFDVARKDRRIFTFGAGGHACPGEALAATIAAAGVGEALRRGVDLDALAEEVSYYPSANVRIPILGTRRTPPA
jgi:cytochrome P450